MLDRRNELDGDAAALPRRNIFAAPAPPVAAPSAAREGMFDVSAGCRPDAYAARDEAEHDTGAFWSRRVRQGAQLAALVLSGLIAAALLNGLSASRSQETPRPAAPSKPPAQARPAESNRARPSRGREADKPRPRRVRRAERPRPRPSRPLRSPAAPRPVPIPPRADPTPPPRPPAPPTPPPRAAPAPVPPNSPPEFM